MWTTFAEKMSQSDSQKVKDEQKLLCDVQRVSRILESVSHLINSPDPGLSVRVCRESAELELNSEFLVDHKPRRSS